MIDKALWIYGNTIEMQHVQAQKIVVQIIFLEINYNVNSLQFIRHIRLTCYHEIDCIFEWEIISWTTNQDY